MIKNAKNKQNETNQSQNEAKKAIIWIVQQKPKRIGERNDK